MKVWHWLLAILVVAPVGLRAEISLADSKTLIDMDSGSPAPALAKSWSKVKDGEYTFELDTSKEIAQGVNVSPAAVKKSLESKLGESYGVKVTPKGANAVSVTYTGDEKQFLDQVGKTKIRGGQDVALALESSVSDGGIRAKKTDRGPNPNEVKAIAIKIDGGQILGKVNDSKSAKIKSGELVKVRGDVKNLKKNDKFFFMPEKKEGDVWVPTAGSLKN